MGKRVGIIGAGITGLVTCKYLLQGGFEPVVFELQSSIGGVWTNPPAPTVPGSHRTPRPAYQFSDFPWPPRSEEAYPNQTKVKQYIESYASHFGLIERIKFNSKVLSIDYVGVADEDLMAWALWGDSGHAFSPNGRWEVAVLDIQLQSTHVYEFDFVVVCIGQFRNAAKLPSFPKKKGPDVFKGKVVHAKEFLALDELDALEIIEGKNVVVVGAQKTAFDIATQCAKENGLEWPCRMVITSPLKNISNFIPKEVHLGSDGTVSKQPVKKAASGVLLSLSATLLHSALSDDFYTSVEEGSIKLEQSTEWHFFEEGLALGSEDAQVEADVVILATGYAGDYRLMSIFKSPTIQKLILSSTSGDTRLYRDCIHPRIPQMAIMATTETFFKIYNSESRAEWLVEFFQGGHRLPTIKEMKEETVRNE